MVYLDDNSGKENSPFMLSLTFVFRLIGPTFGYLLGAEALKTYVYPGMEPDDVEEHDPRWIGAWWIGFPIIATLLLIFSIPLMFFPQRLPKTDTDAFKEVEESLMEKKDQKNKRDEFLPALKRLLTNKLYITNFFSTIFYVFAFMGFGTFMPKYLEYQFRIRASSSARMASSAGTAAKALGLIFSGWLIGKFKFSARTLSTWNVILGFFYFSTLILFSIVSIINNIFNIIFHVSISLDWLSNFSNVWRDDRVRILQHRDAMQHRLLLSSIKNAANLLQRWRHQLLLTLPCWLHCEGANQ